MLDRMDLNISVKKLEYEELFGNEKQESSETIRKRVILAHEIQRKRLQPFKLLYNSQIPGYKLEEICGLGQEEKKLQKEIFEKYELSARAATKILKVARTIADLEQKENVTCDHIWEALSYRMPSFHKGGIRK